MKRGMEFIRLLTEFFDSYLPDTKGVSENTIRSYKAALRIFFIFLEEEKGIPAGKVMYEAAVSLKTARQRNTCEKENDAIDLLRDFVRCDNCGRSANGLATWWNCTTMVNGSTSTSGIVTQTDNSDTTFCMLRLNEIFSLAHMMSWLLVKKESAFLTWQQKLRISSAQKTQHSNAVHSTRGIFSFGATTLIWQHCCKKSLKKKTINAYQKTYSRR